MLKIMKQTFILFLLILISGCSNDPDAEYFFQIIEKCRKMEVIDRADLYSSKILAHRIKWLLKDKDEEKRINSVNVIKNNLSACVRSTQQENYYLDSEAGKPRLNVVYRNPKNKLKTDSFTFVLVDNNWLIDSTHINKSSK
jgi:hypothetical protein